MITYISGPISGIDNAQQNFAEAEKWLLGREMTPMNPFELCAEVHRENYKSDEAYWQQCMKICLEWLPECQQVVLLEGYQSSRGAMAEVYVAQLFTIPIYLLRKKEGKFLEPTPVPPIIFSFEI